MTVYFGTVDNPLGKIPARFETEFCSLGSGSWENYYSFIINILSWFSEFLFPNGVRLHQLSCPLQRKFPPAAKD
jgi:hypothetical protein